MKRGEILDAVKKTITQDRNNRHGEPENSFPRIAEEWCKYLVQRGLLDPAHELTGRTLKPSDVAEMLAIFKGVRFEIQPDNPDNEHDRIGYYAIAAELRAIERGTAAGNDMYIKADKIVCDASSALKVDKLKPFPAIEYPPHMPKSHGELCYYKNNEFVANWDSPTGLIWTLVGRY